MNLHLDSALIVLFLTSAPRHGKWITSRYSVETKSANTFLWRSTSISGERATRAI